MLVLSLYVEPVLSYASYLYASRLDKSVRLAVGDRLRLSPRVCPLGPCAAWLGPFALGLSGLGLEASVASVAALSPRALWPQWP